MSSFIRDMKRASVEKQLADAVPGTIWAGSGLIYIKDIEGDWILHEKDLSLHTANDLLAEFSMQSVWSLS